MRERSEMNYFWLIIYNTNIHLHFLKISILKTSRQIHGHFHMQQTAKAVTESSPGYRSKALIAVQEPSSGGNGNNSYGYI